jgi:glycosyltransferase involved in cell wall biosynthesis
MKIVQMTLGKANPDRMNGVNKVVHAIATEMHRQHMDVEVWGLTPTPQEGTFRREYPLHLFESVPKSFAVSPPLAEAIEALPADTIIHFHGVFAPVYYRIARLLDKRDIPWVVSPHGALMPQSIRRRFFTKWFYLKFFDSFVLRRAKAIHAVTPLEEETIRKWSSVSTIMIPNAYLSEKLTDEDFPRIYTRSRPVFGFVGRLDQVHKGLDLLLDGFAQYKKNNGQGELWLVGDGQDRQKLWLKVQSLGLDSSIRFWGARFSNEKTNLIRNMDVFVHTSRWEGIPISVLEAASLRKPLLVSPGTGLAEAVQSWGAGLTTQTNTKDDIALALKEFQDLARQNKLQTLGDRAHDMLRKDYSWPNTVQLIQSRLYETAQT